MIKNTISVIIPVYNAEKTIYRCLMSVFNQSLLPDEVIIIDDGSIDNSSEIINDFIKNNHLSKTWKLINNSNKGVSKTRNEGIRKAIGEYIAFLDSDDYWEKNKLEKQLSFIEKNNVELLGTAIKESKDSGYSKYSFIDMLYSNKLCTSSVLVKKKTVINKGLFKENMSYSEDYNLWLNISWNNDVYILNEKLTNYTFDKRQGLSSKKWQMEKGELLSIQEMYDKKYITFKKLCFFILLSFGKFIKRCMYF